MAALFFWPQDASPPGITAPSTCDASTEIDNPAFTEEIDPLGLPVVVTSRSRLFSGAGDIADMSALTDTTLFLAPGRYARTDHLTLIDLGNDKRYGADASTVYCTPRPLVTKPWDTPVRFVFRREDQLRILAVYDRTADSVLLGPQRGSSSVGPPELIWRPLSSGILWTTPFALRPSTCEGGQCPRGTEFDTYGLLVAIEGANARIFDQREGRTRSIPLNQLEHTQLDAFVHVAEIRSELVTMNDPALRDNGFDICPASAVFMDHKSKILSDSLQGIASTHVVRVPFPRCLPMVVQTAWANAVSREVTWTGIQHTTSAPDYRDQLIALPVAITELSIPRR